MVYPELALKVRMTQTAQMMSSWDYQQVQSRGRHRHRALRWIRYFESAFVAVPDFGLLPGICSCNVLLSLYVEVDY